MTFDRARRRLMFRVFGLTSAVLVTGAAALAALPAYASGGEIRGAGAADAVPGSYLVVLKVGARASLVADRHGASVTHTYRAALNGYAAKMSDAQARRTAADPSVAYVEQDRVVKAYDTQTPTPSWGLDRIDQRDLPLDSSYTYPNAASTVTAYILDTGIRTTHKDFGGRAVWGTNTTDDDDDTDCHGHGTHVAGTVGGTSYGVAKGVKLVAVKVLDCDGYGTSSGVIAGIDWVTRNAVKPAVANMSLGGDASTTEDEAVQRSIDAGVTYAVAAGNEKQDACNVSPARTPEAITVGATNRSDTRPTNWSGGAAGSNYGPCLDIFAPGDQITSAVISSDTATATWSGTSMASPHVAGAAALHLAANPSATPQQVRDALVANATSGKVVNAGTGSPNKLLYIGSGPTPPPPPTGCGSSSNAGDVAIPDAGAAVTSSIAVTGCSGNAPSTLRAEVHITHSYRGDLVIDLVAPDGTAYR